MDDDEKENILNGIREKCTKCKGCLIWDGTFNNNVCMFWDPDTKKSINVTAFLWNYYNEPIKSTEKLVHTCGKLNCVKIEHIDKTPKATKISKEEVWNRILKNGEIDESTEYNGKNCLIWQGCKSIKGYGRSAIKNRMCYVHRIAFWIFNDEYENILDIPDTDGDQRLAVRHLCSQTSCFEPSHLSLGTGSVNNYEDKIDAGTIQQGEKHHKHIITEELAKKIKWSKVDKNDENFMTSTERAKFFDVPRYEY